MQAGQTAAQVAQIIASTINSIDAVGIQAVAGLGLVDGNTFQLTTTVAGVSTTETYELDSDGTFTAGNIPVSFTAASTSEDVAQGIATAISVNSTIGATATVVGDRVLLGGPDVLYTDVNSTLVGTRRLGATGTAVNGTAGSRVVISGADVVYNQRTAQPTTLLNLSAPFDPDGGGPLPVINPVHLIRINETDTADQIGLSVRNVVQAINAGQILVGHDGARLNFVRDFTDQAALGSGVTQFDAAGVFDAFGAIAGSIFSRETNVTGGQSAEGIGGGFGRYQVDVLAEYTAADIATEVIGLMTPPAPPNPLPANTNPTLVGTDSIQLSANVTANAPFTVGFGNGMGGTITGIAEVGAGRFRILAFCTSSMTRAACIA